MVALHQIDQILDLLRLRCGILRAFRPGEGARQHDGRAGCAAFAWVLSAHRTRSTYALVRVSIFITVPTSRYSGTLIVAPVSTTAGLVPPEAVSPRTPGSASTTLSSIKIGSSTSMGRCS